MEDGNGGFVKRSEAERTVRGEMLLRHALEVCPRKRGGADEAIRLGSTARTRIAKACMSALFDDNHRRGRRRFGDPRNLADFLRRFASDCAAQFVLAA